MINLTFVHTNNCDNSTKMFKCFVNFTTTTFDKVLFRIGCCDQCPGARLSNISYFIIFIIYGLLFLTWCISIQLLMITIVEGGQKSVGLLSLIPPPCFIFESCCFADGILYLLVQGFGHQNLKIRF